MKTARVGVFALAAIFFALGPTSAEDAKPFRHLVYDFGVTFASNVDQQTDTGTATASGSQADHGEIAVDVLAVQPDGGLVVKISEVAHYTRSADAATCVTYGNGQFICESGKKINEEEVALLRILGKDFVNRAAIDAANHWNYSSDSDGVKETSDFTIKNSKDGILSISLSRTLRVSGAQGFTASTDGIISYNEKLTVPISDEESMVKRQDRGMQYNRMEQRITLTLASDSMATGAHL